MIHRRTARHVLAVFIEAVLLLAIVVKFPRSFSDRFPLESVLAFAALLALFHILRPGRWITQFLFGADMESTGVVEVRECPDCGEPMAGTPGWTCPVCGTRAPDRE